MAGEAPSFSTADYLVFSASIIISIGIGIYHWYRSRGQGMKVFFMGGGNMPILPVALSYMAGSISAVSALGYPAEMFYFGTQYWTNLVGVMIGTAICIAFLIPVIYPLKCITIFEFLEVRWSSHVRKLATVLKILHMMIHMGIVLYAPSQALSLITPITTNLSVIILGAISCLYVSLGGAKAVVYTDTFQSVVMVLGVVAVVVRGLMEVGGAANSWAINDNYQRIQFFNLSPDPLIRHTLMTTIMLGINIAFCTTGNSQVEYQRWASVATLSQSIQVVVLGVAGMVSMLSFIYYSGLVVFSVYAECDPLTADYIKKTDQVLIYFVADKLSSLPGIPGLFVAALYSAVMSSMSSSINSVCAMVWKDLLQPLKVFANTSEKRAKAINIIISACIGLVGVLMGVLTGYLGSIAQAANTVSGLINGPAAGIMFVAVLCPWVSQWGVILGAICGFVINMWIGLGSFIYAPPPEMLPLSTDGCPHPNTTTTAAPFTTTTTTLGYDTTTDDHTTADWESEVFPLYRLSYCLYGLIGFLTTLVMSTVCSCFVGFTAPSSVPAETVNRTCLRFYCWLRGADMPLDTSAEASQRQPKPEATETRDTKPVTGKGSLQIESEVDEGVLKHENTERADLGWENKGFEE